MKKKYDIFFDKDNNIYQVRTKNEITLIEFTDKEKEDYFFKIIGLFENAEEYSLQDIQKKNPSFDYSKLLDVLAELTDSGLLFSLNNKYSKNSLSNDSIHLINESTLSYIGSSEMGRIIQEKALKNGYKNINIYNLSDENYRNLEDIIVNSNFIIVDSLYWNPGFMTKLNTLALEKNKPWILIEGTDSEANFSLGPIFHGKETGCYDCYMKRLKSQDEFLPYNNSYEEFLRKESRSSKPSISVQPLILDIAASIIILDITKYIGQWYPPEMWRHTLSIDTTTYQIIKHSFLKAPVCYSCKPSIDYNPAPLFEAVTLKQ
ncbi:MAG: TOMM precursor leader peptide-binding protein [Prevotella sp.]|jgi:thiazole/oxazole-forming peptide maturase SagC family component|nr:TOMM precursor leader peptide-binding protein [Prevotella sp.]MDR2005410.1 TOMM precursor leader peptide-binding protein [Prevotella sp.]